MAGTELLGAERDGKTLELTFYAPARAMVRLHLESAPSKVELDEDIRLDNQWKQETGELEVSLLRGAAPDYRRVLRIHLRYTPHVVEKPDPTKNHRHDSEYDVFDAIRFPLAGDATIPTYPPRLLLRLRSRGNITIASWNHADNVRLAEFELDSAFRGSGSARMFPDEQQFTRIRLQPTAVRISGAPYPPPTACFAANSRSTRPRHGRGWLFAPDRRTGNAHYQYDFDRDGAPEWVLESSRLRLIVSPADGGRALALVDKSTNDEVITLGGASHDFLVSAATVPARCPRPRFPFNRAYRAEWGEEKQGTALRLNFSNMKILPRVCTWKRHCISQRQRRSKPPTASLLLRSPPMAPANNPGPEAVIHFHAFCSRYRPRGGEDARFCWPSDNSPASPIISARRALQKPCPAALRRFCSIGGKLIVVPPEIVRQEVSDSGRRTLTVEWSSA